MILTYSRLGDRGNTGNQLFELATLIALAKRYQARFCLSPRVKSLELWRMFDLTGIPLIDLSEFPRRMIHEWTNYEVIDLDSSEEVIYDLTGYRQCPHYFEEIHPGLIKLFQPRSNHLEIVQAQLKIDQPWIGLHIRRGDSIRWLPLNKLCPGTEGMALLTLAYYRAAIHLIRQANHLPANTRVIVCTDDPKWVQAHLKEIDEYAQLNPVKGIEPKLADFLTLSLSPYTILANSTFSWWAGYLSDKYVVAPWPWFSPNGFIPRALNIVHFPIYPQNWHLIDINSGHEIPNDPNAFSVESAQIQSELVKLIRGYITA